MCENIYREIHTGSFVFVKKKTANDMRISDWSSDVCSSDLGSGHLYFRQKDDEAVIEACCWRQIVARLTVQPEDGLEIICTGRISAYAGRSQYQLIVDSIELAGEGALLKLLEERRRKLAAEGLFDEDRKRPLPFLPDVIGIVTSPTGAVIRDIMHRLRDRFPRHVLLWPVAVQGDTAAAQVAAAIRGFGALPAGGTVPRPGVLRIGRASCRENVCQYVWHSWWPVSLKKK